jgi:hypothetical protein
MTKVSNYKLHKFRDFCETLQKITYFRLQLSQRTKKMFEFSGRFSEISNDGLLLRQLSHFSSISLPLEVKSL